jgi:hypothetical protein
MIVKNIANRLQIYKTKAIKTVMPESVLQQAKLRVKNWNG